MCMDGPRYMVLLLCSHVVLCQACYEAVQESSSEVSFVSRHLHTVACACHLHLPTSSSMFCKCAAQWSRRLFALGQRLSSLFLQCT